MSPLTSPGDAQSRFHYFFSKSVARWGPLNPTLSPLGERARPILRAQVAANCRRS